jgi:RIO-like serine/threonine protein kinase
MGGWYMAVMDFLDTSWRPISATNYKRKDDDVLEEKISLALTKLHQHHMVHGDVRDTNIMVKDDEIMLIDFDWAGVLGQVKYPRMVNKAKELGRPADVEDGELIVAAHDLVTLRNLFKRRRQSQATA